MGLCAAASHFSFSFFAWLPAAPKYPPIIYRLKFLIFGFPFPLSFSRLPAGGPNLPSYSIPPQISDFWFSSLFLSLSFGRLPAGSPQVSSYSIPPQISDFWFSSLFLSFSFCRLPAGSPTVPSYYIPPQISDFWLCSVSFLWLLAGCRLEVPNSPPILYRLKFLIFGFPLSLFPLAFGRLRAGGPKLPSYSIPPQISDFWFSSLFLSLSFGRLPAGSPQVSSYSIPPQISDFWFFLSLSFLLFLPAAGRRSQNTLLLYTASNF